MEGEGLAQDTGLSDLVFDFLALDFLRGRVSFETISHSLFLRFS